MLGPGRVLAWPGCSQRAASLERAEAHRVSQPSPPGACQLRVGGRSLADRRTVRRGFVSSSPLVATGSSTPLAGAESRPVPRLRGPRRDSLIAHALHPQGGCKFIPRAGAQVSMGSGRAHAHPGLSAAQNRKKGPPKTRRQVSRVHGPKGCPAESRPRYHLTAAVVMGLASSHALSQTARARPPPQMQGRAVTSGKFMMPPARKAKRIGASTERSEQPVA